MDENIYEPSKEDINEEEHEQMQQGKGAENNLRDPWFDTEEGQTWLRERNGVQE